MITFAFSWWIIPILILVFGVCFIIYLTMKSDADIIITPIYVMLTIIVTLLIVITMVLTKLLL